MISVAIMGHGTVGSGVAEILLTHKHKLFTALGEELYIKYILDLREFPESPVADRFTKNFNDIINDLDVSIVVEVMGGTNPAYDYVKRSLQAGKSVVTSNKELVAKHGAELLAIAKETNANFLYEASVGGGIPILRPLSQCLVANEVDEIAGILNGTTNFIFGKMINDNMNFDDALKLAQDLGYAERNPEADIEGHDACRKICILASLAFGKHVYPDSVYTEGITKITLDDVKHANNLGYVIKLIGDVKKTENGKLDICVCPMLISKDCILSDINDVFNGIMVKGDCTGDVVFYGKGAGKLPTASAVVADIVDCGKHLKTRKRMFWTDGDGSNIVSYKDSITSVYLRVEGNGDKAVEAFKDSQVVDANGETIILTKEYHFGEIEEKLAALKADGVNVLSAIRVGNI
ncbi:MAG: homoserine dehydrogenase [Ruminococcus sp.]|nr:homoserine dehydrogenase [Ruminococcus sp.]